MNDGGRHLATYSGGASGATYFIHADWLGTERARSTVAGAVCETMTSLPFGDGLATNGSCGDPSPLHFTGKQHDAETGLDHFGARYNSSSMGRFMSPDPIFIHILRVIDPQRLNLYAYARNNPLAFLDPTGKDIVSGTGDQKAIKAALVDIASKPGGRQFLSKLDNLTVKIQLSTGKSEGGEAYGSVKGPFTAQRDASGHVTNATGGPIVVTTDFKGAATDRGVNQALAEQGENLIPNVPSSNAELLGHELAHAENAIFGLPNSEDSANARIGAILGQSTDKNLASDAAKFVDNLLKPKSNDQSAPQGQTQVQDQPQPQNQPQADPLPQEDDEG
jgi:RHS repeat-associated protein